MSSGDSSRQTPAYVDLAAVGGLILVIGVAVLLLLRSARRWRDKEDQQKKHSRKSIIDHEDAFTKRYGYSWDIVLVWKVSRREVVTRQMDQFQCIDKSRIQDFNRIVNRLKMSGLNVFPFYGIRQREIFCKIRAPMERLLLEADRIQYKLELDPGLLREALAKGTPRWKGIQFREERNKVTPVPPFHHIFGNFYVGVASSYVEGRPATVRSFENHLYREWEMVNGKRSILRDVDRIKLIHSILTAPTKVKGCNLNIPRLISEGRLHDMLIIHNYDNLDQLTRRWLYTSDHWGSDYLQSVRDYFGEKIAIYVLWLDHNIRWLSIAAVCGSLAWINVAVTNNGTTALCRHLNLILTS